MNWTIVDNYSFTHLCNFVHDSLRIASRMGRKIFSLQFAVPFVIGLHRSVSYLQPRKTWFAQTMERDSSLSRLLLETPGFTVG